MLHMCLGLHCACSANLPYVILIHGKLVFAMQMHIAGPPMLSMMFHDKMGS